MPVAALAKFLDCSVRVVEVFAEHSEGDIVVVWKPFAAQELIQGYREVRVLHRRRAPRCLGADVEPSPASTSMAGDHVKGTLVHVDHDARRKAAAVGQCSHGESLAQGSAA